MIYTLVLLAASAAVASAQVTFNATTGIYSCPASNPNGAYCAGDSLSTNIIIRCNNGVGQPANCDDNLAGEPPKGVSYAPCWETSLTSGDAVCSKNCIIYGSSGTSTVPGCVQTYTSSSTSSMTASSTSSTTPTTVTSSTTTSTGTTIYTVGSTTITETFTTTYCPGTTLSTITYSLPTSTASPTNGTTTTITYILPTSSAYTLNGTTAASTTSGSATATPVGPTTSGTPTPSTFAGAAVSNSAGAGLAVIGLIVAYFI